MNAIDLLLVAAAVVWILAKQIRVEPVKPRLLVIAPLVLLYFGFRALPDPSRLAHPADIALLVVSAVTSIGLGFLRGGTIAVWRDPAGGCWRKGSGWTLALWGATAVVRIATVAAGHAVGHPETATTGLLLVFLGATFAAQNAVTGWRMRSAARLPVPVTP